MLLFHRRFCFADQLHNLPAVNSWLVIRLLDIIFYLLAK